MRNLILILLFISCNDNNNNNNNNNNKIQTQKEKQWLNEAELGMIFRDFNRAVNNYNKALKINPRNMEVLDFRGEAKYNLEYY